MSDRPDEGHVRVLDGVRLCRTILDAFVRTRWARADNELYCDPHAFADEFADFVRRAPEYGVRYAYTAFNMYVDGLMATLPLVYTTGARVFDEHEPAGEPTVAFWESRYPQLATSIRARRVADEVHASVCALAGPEHYSALRQFEHHEGALLNLLDEALADLWELKLLDCDLRQDFVAEAAPYLSESGGNPCYLFDREQEGLPSGTPQHEPSLVVDVLAHLLTNPAGRISAVTHGLDYLSQRQRVRDLARWWDLTGRCRVSLLRAADAIDAAKKAHALSAGMLLRLPYDILADHLLPLLDVAQLASMRSTSRAFTEGAFGQAITSRLPFWRLRSVPGTLLADETHEAFFTNVRRQRRDQSLLCHFEAGFFPHHREHIPGFAGDRAQNFVDCRKSVTLMVELCTLHKRPKALVPHLKVRAFSDAVQTAFEAQAQLVPPPPALADLHPVLLRRRFLAIPEGDVATATRQAEACMADVAVATVHFKVLKAERTVADEEEQRAAYHHAGGGYEVSRTLDAWRAAQGEQRAVARALDDATRALDAAYARDDWPCGVLPPDHYSNRGPDPHTDPLRGGPASKARIHWLNLEFGLPHGTPVHHNQSNLTFLHFRAEPLDPLYERRRVVASDYFSKPFECSVDLLHADDDLVCTRDTDRAVTPRCADAAGPLEPVCGFDYGSFSPPTRVPHTEPPDFFASTLPARTKCIVRALSGGGKGAANRWGATTGMNAYKLRVNINATKHSGREVHAAIVSPRFYTVNKASVLAKAKRRARDAEDRAEEGRVEAAAAEREADAAPDAKARRLLAAAATSVG